MFILLFHIFVRRDLVRFVGTVEIGDIKLLNLVRWMEKNYLRKKMLVFPGEGNFLGYAVCEYLGVGWVFKLKNTRSPMDECFVF